RRVPARHGPWRGSGAWPADPAVPHGQAGPVRVPHRAGAGSQPADPADGGALRAPGQAAGPGPDWQRQARAPEAWAVAEPDRGRAARAFAAAQRMVRPAPPPAGGFAM